MPDTFGIGTVSDSMGSIMNVGTIEDFAAHPVIKQLFPVVVLFFIVYAGLSLSSFFKDRKTLKVITAIIIVLFVTASTSFMNWYSRLVENIAVWAFYLLIAVFFLWIFHAASQKPKKAKPKQ